MLIDIEGLAIHLQLHLRPLTKHRHLVEGLCILCHVDGWIVMVGIRLGNREGTHHVLVAREARRERILSVGETRNKETALGVADSPLEDLGVSLLSYSNIDKLQRSIGLFVQDASSYLSLCPRNMHADQKQQQGEINTFLHASLD